MSLASSPDFQIRPEDKVFDMFFPGEDPLTDSFDDYLNENYNLSDGDNKETFDSFLEFFEKEATARGNGCLSPIGGSSRQNASPPQPWRKGLWCLNQNGALLPGSAAQNGGSGAQNINGDALNSREVASHQAGGRAFTNFSRPVPQPRTPSSKGTKKILTTSPRTARKGQHVPQTFSREGTLSPKSSYARNQHNNKMAYQESLQRHLQNFHLLAGDEAELLSSPPSGRPTQPEHSVRVHSANVARNGLIVHNQVLTIPIANVNDTYPSIEHRHTAVDPGLESVFYSNSSNNMLTAHDQALNTADYLHDPHNPHNQTDSVWREEIFHSLIGPEFLFDSQARYKYVGEMQPHWSPPAASGIQPDAPRSYQEHYPIIAAPTPHRPTHQLLQNPVSPQIDGLGIQYSGIDSSTAGRAHPNLSPLEPAYSYPSLPEIAPEPIHTFADTSPFTTPCHHHPTDLSPSRSTSPSISPRNTKYNYANTSRSLRQTSPTRQSARRKSIGAPKASSFTNSHHHHTSSTTTKAPRTPRTPKTPTGPGAGFGAIDFVNFTPKDSAKLLSDVAPSGSSKTRARREQEARDKRRRLSEAAVRAVRRVAKAAGGDVGDGEVEALERAILA
jgi:hypothetical protein